MVPCWMNAISLLQQVVVGSSEESESDQWWKWCGYNCHWCAKSAIQNEIIGWQEIFKNQISMIDQRKMKRSKSTI